MIYRVNDLYSAIQGEGARAGVPMALIRLQGCGVGCPWCDTRETWRLDERHRVGTLAEALGTGPRWAEVESWPLALMASRAAPQAAWALVTGGEPAEQDLIPLVAALKSYGFRAALETSGTAGGHLGAGFDWVCVSPKVGMPGGRPILPDALAPADEIKMVIGKPADLETLDALLALPARFKPGLQISLQPVSQSEKATALCVETVKRRGGTWRLSLQLHKYLSER